VAIDHGERHCPANVNATGAIRYLSAMKEEAFAVVTLHGSQPHVLVELDDLAVLL